jgi:hypothetical protein
VKSRLPRKPQPVPPIFQPEVAADAIYFAAFHRRREIWVGLPTTKAILADRIAPGLVDRYLAAHGYSAQQTDEPDAPDRPHNLWQPVDDAGGGDFGAHGRFDQQAHSHSTALALAKARPWIQAVAGGVAALVVAGAAARLLRNGPSREMACGGR